MNQKETLALFAKGKGAWNDHWRDMLEHNRPSLADGSWDEAAKADFKRHEFWENADFRGFHFPGAVDFSDSTFCKGADFEGARFDGRVEFGEAIFLTEENFKTYASFRYVTFYDSAFFSELKFKARANFFGATFSKIALFDDAVFSKVAFFDQAIFKGATSFDRTLFCAEASFTGMSASSGFTLKKARFAELPDFVQAHFAEAPCLDDVHIPKVGFVKATAKSAADDTEDRYVALTGYRALKRMAVQGHDHVREQDFFAGELKASRGYLDKWWHARWWFGWFYQILSDFGRSMVLPLMWWALATGGFTCAYRAQRALQTLNDSCLVGQGKAVWAAFGLAVRKALPFPGIGSAEKLNQIFACLYGIHGQPAPGGLLPERFTPIIPDAVDYLGIGQTLLSILLLFLFLLAVRNHFRIK